MDRKCPECKKKNKNYGKYCIHCGNEFPIEDNMAILLNLSNELRKDQQETSILNKNLFSYTIATSFIAFIAMVLAFIDIYHMAGGEINSYLFSLLYILMIAGFIVYIIVVLYVGIFQPTYEFSKKLK